MKKILFLSLISLSMIACEGKRYVLKDNDPKMVFLESHYPQMKITRQELAREVEVCKANLAKLDTLYGTFEQKSSKDFVYEKVKILTQDRSILVNQLNKVDAEIEKSMAVETFNSIDQGGLKLTQLNSLMEETTTLIFKSRNLNKTQHQAYNTSQ